ncbi:16288_t:CDS:2, partial [Funneliformis geosporum]
PSMETGQILVLNKHARVPILVRDIAEDFALPHLAVGEIDRISISLSRLSHWNPPV